MPRLASEAGDFALELYDFLRTIDRSPPEAETEAIRARAEQMRARCDALARKAGKDAGGEPIAGSVQALVPTFEQLRQRLHAGSGHGALASFRRSAAPQYETLVARLRAHRVEAPSLRPANVKRNAYHLGNGIFAALCIQFLPSWTWVIAFAGAFFAFAWTMEVGRRHSAAWNRFAMWLFRSVAHPHEEHRVNSATWYATALFAIALLAGPVPCLLAVLALGLGDPAAALVGRRFGRIRLPGGRSLEGSLAFAVVAFAAVLGALALWHGGYSLSLRLGLAATAAVVGALVEIVSGAVDDNFSIPVAVAAASAAVLWAAGV